MSFKQHIKLASFIGLLLGIIFGLVDFLARLLTLSFDWFELYQTLLFPIVVFVVFFSIIALLIELFSRLSKHKISHDRLLVIHTVNAVSLFLLFYLSILPEVLNTLLPFKIHPGDSWSVLVFLFVGLVYYLLSTKGSKILLNLISFLNKSKISSLVKNIIFLVLIFVSISFVLDLYYLNYVPSSPINTDLAGSPNVILITLDTVRADHLSLQGYPYNTSPNLDAFAEKSVIFNRAISVTSWTLPSHASMFTGRFPFNHGAINTHQFLIMEELTIAEILREKGYNTVGYAGGPYCKRKYGIAQGFTHYLDRFDFLEYAQTPKIFNIRRILPLKHQNIFGYDGYRNIEEINKDVFSWLSKNHESPFFMFINYFDAHDPYTLGTEFRSKFTNEVRDYDEVANLIGRGEEYPERYAEAPEDLINYTIALYDTEIFYLDYHLQTLLARLDDLGLTDNTIIIITADHGEEFYEHGGFVHEQTLYNEVIQVPLMIYYPNEFEPKRINTTTGIINIFPTILDFLGMDIPNNINSKSLVPLMQDETPENDEIVYSEFFGRHHLDISDQKSAISENWKLIEVNPEQDTLPSGLFYLENDSSEQNNLYGIETEIKSILQKDMLEIMD